MASIFSIKSARNFWPPPNDLPPRAQRVKRIGSRIRITSRHATPRSGLVQQSIGETFTTPGGYELPRAEELYRKFAASQRATRNFESVYDDVSQRRGVLKGRIAETTQQLQASTSDAETQKLTGVITGYNAELAAIDKEVDGALAESLVLDIQNREDREKQEQARKEERMAEFSEAMSNYSKTFRIDDAPPAFPTR